MFSITPKQHSKILGFGLISYSWSLLLSSLKLLFSTETNRNISNILSEIHSYYGSTHVVIYFLKEYSDFFYFLIIFVSGISILLFKGKRKFISLLFVFFYINVFPLGTILCFYTLFYLFVISENKIITEENSLKETE